MTRWAAVAWLGQEHAFDMRDEPESDQRDAIVSRCGHATAQRVDVDHAPERPSGQGCAFCRRVMTESMR